MATATDTKAATSPSFEIPFAADATKRVRELNNRIVSSAKAAGLVSLDAYEKAVGDWARAEEKVASASKLGWVSSLASTHATFLTEVSASYAKAAKGLLA